MTAVFDDLRLCLSSAGAASQQTSRFSAYEVTVPKRISRQRRDVDGQAKDKVKCQAMSSQRQKAAFLEVDGKQLPCISTAVAVPVSIHSQSNRVVPLVTPTG